MILVSNRIWIRNDQHRSLSLSFFSLSLYIYLSLSLSHYLFFSLSSSVPIFPSFHPSFHLSFHLSIYLSIHPSLPLSLSLSIHPSSCQLLLSFEKFEDFGLLMRTIVRTKMFTGFRSIESYRILCCAYGQ